MSPSQYDKLVEFNKETSYLDQAASILHWDQETYMPPGAVEDRAAQLSTLSAMIHQRNTSSTFGDLLSGLKNDKTLSETQSAVVREYSRKYERMTSLPEELVREITKTQSLAQQAWAKARKENDYPAFRPFLDKMIELKQKEAECVGYDDKPYDALLDEYEPYMTCREVTEVFSRLRDRLVPIVEKIAAAAEIDDSILTRGYPLDRQEQFSKAIVTDLGYDWDHGRLDITAHPFTTGGNRDVRITTRYSEEDLRPALFASIHEAGHALYEQGYLEEHYHTPMAEPISLGIHESQSRMWENLIGRGLPFWQHYLPKLKETFPNMTDVGLVQFHRAINKVKPSFIRVEADEVTYNLHILLRYEIETEIFDGKITAEEMPSVWNERFEKYLGITPPDDANGCLQDIHWSMGLFGYFPTYALGNLYSAQFLNAARKTIPDLGSEVSRGEFKTLLGWLRHNIHQHGKFYPAQELAEKVTRERLNEDHFISYLKEKYSQIYEVSL